MNIAFIRPTSLGNILGILRSLEMMQSPASQMSIWHYPLSFLRTSLIFAVATPTPSASLSTPSLLMATSMAFLLCHEAIILDTLGGIHISGFGSQSSGSAFILSPPSVAGPSFGREGRVKNGIALGKL